MSYLIKTDKIKKTDINKKNTIFLMRCDFFYLVSKYILVRTFENVKDKIVSNNFHDIRIRSATLFQF